MADTNKTLLTSTLVDLGGLGTFWTKSKEYVDGKITSVNKTIEDNEQVTSNALTDLDTRVNNLSNSISTAGVVTITETAGTGDVLKTYTFTQNGAEIGKINLAKDLVVTSGEVKMCTLDDVDVKCLELTLSSGDVVHIPVTDLVDVYTAGEYITVGTDNKISVNKSELLADYYTKTQVDGLVNAKANSADVYTKTQVDGLVNAKANSADVYTKTEVDNALSGKVDTATLSGYYTKTEVDTELGKKANSADVYTKTEVDNALSGKVDTATLGSYYTKTEVDTKVSDSATSTLASAKAYTDELGKIVKGVYDAGTLVTDGHEQRISALEGVSIASESEILGIFA